MNSRPINHALWIVIFAAVHGGSWAWPVLAAEEEPAQKAGPVVDLRTVYLVEPIERAHQIMIRGELGGKGTVTLDGNTCAIGQFGDTTICTKIAFPPIDVDIVQLRVADYTGQGRRLYQLKGKLTPADYQYFLIVPRRRSESHRLVVNMPADRRRAVTLESGASVRDASPGGRPELCKDGNYSAEQASEKVVVVATGESPTAGYKVRFEQLPIRIFPPQFRLVCVPPKGLAAQVITPFKVQTSFAAKDPVKQVTVHDARGQHRVPVKQVR